MINLEHKKLWGSKQDVTRAANKLNKLNGNRRLEVLIFGPLYFLGTKEEFKKL